MVGGFTMEDSTENIDELLNEAMNAEKQAKEFYLYASEQAQSNVGKKLFKELAEFEQNHYDRVMNIIESRNSGETIKCSVSCQDIPEIKSEIEGEVEPNKDEVVMVINLAIKAEKNAQARYQKIADMLEDEEQKEIFNNLAQDERNHQRILEDEFYNLSNKGTIIWE
jgi:rubrerythrin